MCGRLRCAYSVRHVVQPSSPYVWPLNSASRYRGAHLLTLPQFDMLHYRSACCSPSSGILKVNAQVNSMDCSSVRFLIVEARNTVAVLLRGTRSRNKVFVGKPAKDQFERLCKDLWDRCGLSARIIDVSSASKQGINVRHEQVPLPSPWTWQRQDWLMQPQILQQHALVAASP